MSKYIDNNGFAHFLGKLKTLLDAKANSQHTHSASDITSGDIVNGVKGNAENSYRTGTVNITLSDVGAAAASHTHGNIQNGGALQSTDITIASGDQLVVTDASDSNKIARTSITFDGTTTTKALTQKGTFESFSDYTHPTYTAYTGKPTANQTPGFGNAFSVSQVVTDTTGHVSSITDYTVTIPEATMSPSSSSTAGSKGLVPAPAAGDQDKYLKGDGTWDAPSFTLATASSSVKGGVKIGDGLSMTGNDSDTLTVPVMTGATASANGTTGLVPAAPMHSTDFRKAILFSSGAWYKLSASTSYEASNNNYNIILQQSIPGTGSVELVKWAIPPATSNNSGVVTPTQISKLNSLPDNATLQSTYALKSDIASMYKHKGSVSAVANLPSSDQTAGDVYNVTSTGMNYVWTGEAWDALGEVFSIDSMTTTEIDTAFTTAGLTAS